MTTQQRPELRVPTGTAVRTVPTVPTGAVERRAVGALRWLEHELAWERALGRLRAPSRRPRRT